MIKWAAIISVTAGVVVGLLSAFEKPLRRGGRRFAALVVETFLLLPEPVRLGLYIAAVSFPVSCFWWWMIFGEWERP